MAINKTPGHESNLQSLALHESKTPGPEWSNMGIYFHDSTMDLVVAYHMFNCALICILLVRICTYEYENICIYMLNLRTDTPLTRFCVFLIYMYPPVLQHNNGKSTICSRSEKLLC